MYKNILNIYVETQEMQNFNKFINSWYRNIKHSWKIGLIQGIIDICVESWSMQNCNKSSDIKILKKYGRNIICIIIIRCLYYS